MPYIKRQWPALILILLLTLITATVTAFMPWPLKILVDYALGDTALPQYLTDLLGRLSLIPTPLLLISLASLASLALFALNSVLRASTTWCWSVTG